jgi:hypothetical protein
MEKNEQKTRGKIWVHGRVSRGKVKEDGGRSARKLQFKMQVKDSLMPGKTRGARMLALGDGGPGGRTPPGGDGGSAPINWQLLERGAGGRPLLKTIGPAPGPLARARRLSWPPGEMPPPGTYGRRARGKGTLVTDISTTAQRDAGNRLQLHVRLPASVRLEVASLTGRWFCAFRSPAVVGGRALM